MPISFQCSGCGKSYNVRKELAGRKLKCRECERPIQVPRSKQDDEFIDLPSHASRRERLPNRSTRRRSPDKAKQRPSSGSNINNKTIAITIGVALLFMIPVVGGYMVMLNGFKGRGLELPPVETNPVPYLKRRSELVTNLVRKGPAPQDYESFDPPRGVDEVTYDSQGRKLKAWVDRRGAQGEKSPAIVFLHGGFALGAEDIEACAPFRDAGFIVMTPTVRAENGNPGNFELFLGEVDDAANACRWLADQEDVDPARIYTFGHSVGGGISALLSLQKDVPVVCTASSGGLYSDKVFMEWMEFVPFRQATDEQNVRILLGNIAYMQTPHVAYLGRQDDAFILPGLLAEHEMKDDSLLEIERVLGDHFTALPRSMHAFLQYIKTLPDRS